MKNLVIAYTDLPWAIGPEGRVDPNLAVVERRVFGEHVELRFGHAENGQYELAGPQLLRAVSGADALVVYRLGITEEVLDAVGANLKVVGRQGVGIDNLAPKLLQSRGIIGINVPDYCVDEVVTHTMALALALERQLIAQHQGLAAGKFNIYAGGVPRRLRNATAGILGFGRIGRALCTRLREFYGKVLACDPYVDADLMVAYGAEKVDLDTLLSQSDLLSLHCLLNDETRGLVDASALAKMKKSAYLVNAARGALVNGKALYEALAEQRIAGAAIDVFSPEDPHRDPWYSKVTRLPNVVVTSHRAFLSSDSEASLRRRTSEAVRGVLMTGQPPVTGNVTGSLPPAS